MALGKRSLEALEERHTGTRINQPAY
jgi:hypothetical protein